jgi:anti-sigma regulatory factor (Ser/Thr protein kinase)
VNTALAVTSHVAQVLLLPAETRSAAVARHALRDLLVACGRQELRDDAELALTELVTNAVMHAGTPVTVRLACSANGLRVEVTDDDVAGLPRRRVARPSATSGRGIALVAALADEHGVDVGTRSKTAWFTLAGRPAST